MFPSINPGPLSIELHRESPVNMVAHLYWSDCNVISWHWSWLSRSQRHASHLHCSELCKSPREGAILRVQYPELIGYIRVVCNFYFEGLCWNPSFRMEYPWDFCNFSLPMLDTEVEQHVAWFTKQACEIWSLIGVCQGWRMFVPVFSRKKSHNKNVKVLETS